jgi:hypothetical protein
MEQRKSFPAHLRAARSGRPRARLLITGGMFLEDRVAPAEFDPDQLES